MSVRVVNGIYELAEDVSDSAHWNKDIAPTTSAARKWGRWDIAALWVGMSVCNPTYMLAGTMIDVGMTWWQAILTIFLGNLIVLVPMILNAHAGTKYGIPFPVYCRASFGVVGSNVPAILRAIVACGWFGIQTWLGGDATYTLLKHASVWPGIVDWHPFPAWLGVNLPGQAGWLGINAGQLVCFLVFWLVNMIIIWRGMESIRWLEDLSAPFLIVVGLALLAWAYVKAGGFGPMFHAKATADFWSVFPAQLTAMVGFWATLSLNIPDFSRFAKSQKEQLWGQTLGLPTTMTLYSFVGVAVTSAAYVIYNPATAEARAELWNPVTICGRFENPVVVAFSILALWIATLTTNLAANVVSPANDISNIAPRHISFRLGGMITGVIGILMMPWRLLAKAGDYVFVWLIGYGALLGPIGGILIADYFILRNTRLRVADLYRRDGAYAYQNGWNPRAIVALVIGIVPNLPGFLASTHIADPTRVHPFFMSIYNYAWFVGFFVSFVSYILLMSIAALQGPPQPGEDPMPGEVSVRDEFPPVEPTPPPVRPPQSPPYTQGPIEFGS